MRLSLNETWKRCLKMWKGVIDILGIARRNGEQISVGLIKEIWLQQQGYKSFIHNDCFFCNYAKYINNPDIPGGCPCCPGTKVDPDFACQLPEYHWAEKPEEFYKKLLQLDKKRKRQNRRKK